jgi:hypothetical protein
MLEDSFASHGKRTAVVVGILHGVGAPSALAFWLLRLRFRWQGRRDVGNMI